MWFSDAVDDAGNNFDAGNDTAHIGGRLCTIYIWFKRWLEGTRWPELSEKLRKHLDIELSEGDEEEERRLKKKRRKKGRRSRDAGTRTRKIMERAKAGKRGRVTQAVENK